VPITCLALRRDSTGVRRESLSSNRPDKYDSLRAPPPRVSRCSRPMGTLSILPSQSPKLTDLSLALTTGPAMLMGVSSLEPCARGPPMWLASCTCTTRETSRVLSSMRAPSRYSTRLCWVSIQSPDAYTGLKRAWLEPRRKDHVSLYLPLLLVSLTDRRYFTDSLVNHIHAYDYDDGKVSNRRIFIDPLSHGQPELSYPDGLCIDSEGGLWSARLVCPRYRPEQN
jgi:hypothetical protein